MEEQIEAFQAERVRRQRSRRGRQKHLLEKIAQPREVLKIRGSILGILAIAFALSVSSKSQSTDNSQRINFWDITSYKYCFVTIVIGIAYNSVAFLLNLLQYFVPNVREKILFELEFLCDKVIACLLGTGAAAGLGASVDLQKASAYPGASLLLIMGEAVCSFLVGACFLAFVLSLCSSRAYEERGNSIGNRQENERTPLPEAIICNPTG